MSAAGHRCEEQEFVSIAKGSPGMPSNRPQVSAIDDHQPSRRQSSVADLRLQRGQRIIDAGPARQIEFGGEPLIGQHTASECHSELHEDRRIVGRESSAWAAIAQLGQSVRRLS